MNTIPPNDTDRHIAMLQRLAELGMQLAEKTAAEATEHRRPDPSLLFIRLSAMVQACIADRVRLAARKRNTGTTFNEMCQTFGISYETTNLPMH